MELKLRNCLAENPVRRTDPENEARKKRRGEEGRCRPEVPLSTERGSFARRPGILNGANQNGGLA